MVQKVLAAHHLYYASAWLLLSSQVNMIDKILRDFFMVRWEMEHEKALCQMGLVFPREEARWIEFKRH